MWYLNCSRSVATYPQNHCLGCRDPAAGDEAPFHWLSYEEVNIKVEAIGSSLAAVGMDPKSRVGIFSANCPEWMITMQVPLVYSMDPSSSCMGVCAHR